MVCCSVGGGVGCCAGLFSRRCLCVEHVLGGRGGDFGALFFQGKVDLQ